MEYREGGIHARMAHAHGGMLSPRDAWPFLLQALNGLAYMPDQSIIHRNLKPKNMLPTGAGPPK